MCHFFEHIYHFGFRNVECKGNLFVLVKLKAVRSRKELLPNKFAFLFVKGE